MTDGHQTSAGTRAAPSGGRACGRRHLFLAAALLAFGPAACDSSEPRTDTAAPAAGAPVPPPPNRAAVSSELADTVPLDALVFWTPTGAQQAMRSSALEFRMIQPELSYGGLTNGSAFAVGDAEVHLFFYGDIAAADAAYRRLDARQLRPIQPRVAADARPRAFINNNMLVILYSGDDAQRRRIIDALTPGFDDRHVEEVEP